MLFREVIATYSEIHPGLIKILCGKTESFNVKVGCSYSNRSFKGSDHRFYCKTILFAQEKTCYQRVLNSWYGSSKQVWRLVYRASSHGYSAESFHIHCDGVAPTYVIAMVSVVMLFNDTEWGYSVAVIFLTCI